MLLIPLVRTGQSHRSLLGHTAPVTCLQFDELNIVSGSLDSTIRVSASRCNCSGVEVEQWSGVGSSDGDDNRDNQV
jgi:hypothetical protein